ncbi:multicopper oxidase domain-containing protein [Flavobacterium terrisoli]|uniref:multicopper oxidase domain-containing protein n=1 Tax=Flavobacterium terrisoli TaxID=3242195 RepID=UPI002543534A|nr:multicopper oxidase domain-containing protein [Flavobacterium buctense]
MRKAFLIFFLIMLPSLSQAQSVSYTCPMHPEVHSPKPGKCPKCGMNLVKEKTKAKPKTVKAVKPKSNPNVPENEETVAKYTCPMHPEIVSDKPGNCPRCGMKLIVQDKKTVSTDETKAVMPEDHEHHEMERMDMPTDDLSASISLAKKNLGKIKTVKAAQPPRTVRYDLHIRDTVVMYGKKKKRAIAVNGQIPMPTLTFTEGDTAEIHVYNHLKEETSLHWHGLFLPNQMDGVPYMTQMPIKPGAEYLYKFPIIQHGTHWYHSHSGLQEQIGMYGMFIMNKREEWDIPTIPVLLSEWTDMKPEEVHRRLKNANDWFAIKKGTTQSYTEAIASGHFGTKVTNEWKRMTAMDVSDVYYENFLINGKNQDEHPQFKAGDKVRLRIANGGASDYFWLNYAGGKITVVATDGNEVEPVAVDRLLIAVSETYDVVVTIPDNKSFEFLVTPEDRTKSASLWLGSGEKVSAGKMPRLKYFEGMKMMNDMMDMNGNMVEMDGMKMQNQIMDMNTVMYPEITGEEKKKAKKEETENNHAGHNMDAIPKDIVTLNYEMLRAREKTTLPNGEWRELKFELTGNMNRYVWSLDNKVVSETDKILIKKGQNLRIVLFNNSMMRHPMHLHGHDFRVVNSQGDYAPMKNIIDIMPMERDTIEFAATEPGGDWFFHCHILYHMMSGMGRVFSYENSPKNPELPNAKFARRKLNSDDREFHFMAENDFATNGNDGMAMLANTRWSIGSEWRLGYNDMHGYESETHIGRYIGRNQWFMPFIGFDLRYRKMEMGETEENLFGQKNTKDKRAQFSIGAAYTLPMLVILQGELYHDGNVRLQLMREDIPISPRIRAGFMVNTDREYMVDLRYIFDKNISARAHYDSDMDFGVGVMLNY